MQGLVERKILKKIPHVSISSNLIDPDVAVFNRDVFDDKIVSQGLDSVSLDLIPYLVKEQFQEADNKSAKEHAGGGNSNGETKKKGMMMDGEVEDMSSGDVENMRDAHEKDDDDEELGRKQRKESSNSTNACSGELSFDDLQKVIAEMTHGNFEYEVREKKDLLCSVYIVPPEKYCAKVDTIEAYGEISKDLTSSEFSHMLPPNINW